MVPKDNLKDKEVVEARMKQLNKWKDFDVYEEVEDCGQERIQGGWVDVYKEFEGKTIVKSRFVARGYMENSDIQSDSPTVSKISKMLTCAIAASFGWKIESKDYRSAFLQGEELDRVLYMEPPPEEKKPGVIWRLKKAVYGLNDASRKWWLKCSGELEDLGCVKSAYDPALFLYFGKHGKLSGIVCLHVDDELGCGSEEFRQNVWNKLDERLIVKCTETDVFRYVGLNIKQTSNCISIDQQHYIETLELVTDIQFKDSVMDDGDFTILNDVGQSIFKAKVGALNWLATQTRPDIAYEVMEFSTCFKRATLRNLKDVNKCIKKVKQESVNIVFPKLICDVKEWKLVVYGDGAFANLPDKTSSSGGHILFIQDGDGNSCPVRWSVNKIQRGVRSSLASEALTLQESLEDGLYVRELLCELFGDDGRLVKINSVTDSKSLKNAVYSTSLVKDKLLRINIAAIKQMIEKYNIIIDWKPGKVMIAGCSVKETF